jgi:hypothetical protein
MRARSVSVPRLLPYAIPLSLAVGFALLAYPSSESTQAKSERDAPSVRRSSAPIAPAKASSLVEQIEAKAASAIGEPARNVVPVASAKHPAVRQLVEAMAESEAFVPVESLLPLMSQAAGQKVNWNLGGMSWSGTVQSRTEQEGILRLHVELEDGLGSLLMNLRQDQTIWASVLFQGESHAISMQGKPENGHWAATLTTVDRVLCAPSGSTFPPQAAGLSMPLASPGDAPIASGQKIASIPKLDSNPTSPYVFYIDFDGELVDQPEWTSFTNGQPIDAQPHGRAEDDGFVTRVWKRVTEDFAPFNVNVTTDRAVFEDASSSKRMMCIVTSTNFVGSGGVAFVESFGSDLVCWCFNSTEDTAADTVSHELGHALGLGHDGQTTGVEYYGGHGAGEVSWAPIMGAYFGDSQDDEFTQWSIGEYPDANNQQDDLKIIAGSRNGFGYRTDDHSNTKEKATFIIPSDNETISQSGIIEKNTDEDWFFFPTTGGSVEINANAFDVNSSEFPQRGSNLAVSLSLYDKDGKLLAEHNPQDQMDASISMELPLGNYYLKVTGAGRGDLETGFSNYASLGQYTINGTVPIIGIVDIDPYESNYTRDGGRGKCKVLNVDEWSWSSDVPWITSSMATHQKGKNEFTFDVAWNPTREARKGTITITGGPLSVVHTVYQDGPLEDDHGDTFEKATLVDQNSSTDGKFHEPGDVHMFRIDVRGFGKLTVKTSGDLDTIADLYDNNGLKLASDDESLSPNMLMTQSVSAGTYYVGVRNAVEGALGRYTFHASFEATSALMVTPETRRIGPAAGEYVAQVISSQPWTWSTDAQWLVLPESATRNTGGEFSYKVHANKTNKTRKARIIFSNGRSKVAQTIVQSAADSDDHADTQAGASELLAGGAQRGRIQFDGDADMFKIRLRTSGVLKIISSGSIDTVGELLNATGDRVVMMDGGNGDNFVIQQDVPAGTYYLRVTAFANSPLGSYSLRCAFSSSRILDVSYAAGRGGLIAGPKGQSVPLGGDAITVTAIPSRGYSFLRWSDGFRESKRSDKNLRSPLSVSAEFAPTLELRRGSQVVSPAATHPVDFGSLPKGERKTIEFMIRNQGRKPLTNLRVSLSGGSTLVWKASAPSRTTVAPGGMASVKISLSGESSGLQLAQWKISASGQSAAFTFRTMGDITAASRQKALSSLLSEDAKTPSVSHPAGESPWIDLSPDGFFRYRFERPLKDTSERTFWLSPDGLGWEEALVLDVWETHSSEKSNHFEAIFAPLHIPAPRIFVLESKPLSAQEE